MIANSQGCFSHNSVRHRWQSSKYRIPKTSPDKAINQIDAKYPVKRHYIPDHTSIKCMRQESGNQHNQCKYSINKFSICRMHCLSQAGSFPPPSSCLSSGISDAGDLKEACTHHDTAGAHLKKSKSSIAALLSKLSWNHLAWRKSSVILWYAYI